MSSNFLQRFKGKTQAISKDGVHDILGGGQNAETKVYTNSNSNGINQKAYSSKTSCMNGSKKTGSNAEIKKETKSSLTKPQEGKKPSKGQIPPPPKEPENPFLISNPFYLDEEERQREEAERKQLQRQEKQRTKNEKQMNRTKQDPKKGTYSSMRKSSTDKKKGGDKEWVKLGGLGPNLGGDQWEEKRKKKEKMQEFANQVKAINSSLPSEPKQRPPKPTEKKDNPRSKALEYSKNVPKPVLRQEQQFPEDDEMQPIKEINQNQLSELELYELKHRQLQERLRNEM